MDSDEYVSVLRERLDELKAERDRLVRQNETLVEVVTSLSGDRGELWAIKTAIDGLAASLSGSAGELATVTSPPAVSACEVCGSTELNAVCILDHTPTGGGAK